jgi:hypothetical protein
MNNKRNIYLGLMFLTNLIGIGMSFYIGIKSIVETIGFLSIYFVLIFLISLIISTISSDLFDYCFFPIGFLTINRKKIYYSTLGYFYIRQRGDLLTISEQGWFTTKRLFEIRIYNGDIDDGANT